MKEQLTKYFSGEMSPTEKALFFQELKTDPEAQKEFARMKNTQAVLGLMDKKGDEEKTLRGIRKFDTLIHRRSIKQFRLNLLKYAAIAIVLVASSWFLSREYTLNVQTDQYTEINVPKGQRVNMTLADGTSVWLSPRTKIRIPNQFNRGNRTVELDGEGYFAVTKDPGRPFIVKTRQFDIEVLGTEFNVFAYGKLPRFETDLVKGAVWVYNNKNKNEGLHLKPNEKVSVINDVLVKSSSDFYNAELLKNGVYSFKSKPFVEILDCLSLWYDVKFNVTGTIALTRKISGKFRQNEDVEKILGALQGVYYFNFKRINDNEFEIY